MKKNLLATLLFVSMNICLITQANSQNVSIPQKEFRIFTDDSIKMEQASEKKIDVVILRSKQYKRKVRMDVSSSLPNGVEIRFDPPQGAFDHCVATINVGASAKPGTYLVIISGTIQSKSIGRMLKLTVADKM